MNVYKPLMIFDVTHSITVMTDGCVNFRKFLIGAPNQIRRRSRNRLNAPSCCADQSRSLQPLRSTGQP